MSFLSNLFGGSPLNASVRGIAAEQVDRRIVVNPQATRDFFLPTRLKNMTKLSDPYRQHGMTHAASRAIATNISQVPFLVHVGASEEDEDVLRDGPWVELFDRPNPISETRAQFWETTILHLLDVPGMCVWVKEGLGDERIAEGEIPSELWPISGRWWTPVVNETTKLISAWAYQPPGQAKPTFYDPHELVIHRCTDPNNPYGGLGAYAPAELAFVQDYKAARYNEAFFDNDATPGGLLLTEGRLNETQKQQIKEAWEERHQGSSRRRRIAMLEGGLKYEETGSTHREMEFEKGRAFSWKEELAVLGTPEYEVGLTQNINMATAQMISKDWVTKRLCPLMHLLEDGMWSQLFRPVEGGARALLYSDARMVKRRRQAARANFPGAAQKLHRQVREYREFRKLVKLEHRVGWEPQRVQPDKSLWGEFDLTSIEALREDFGAKLEQAQKAQQMGVPFNQVNERLDLGFENLEGDAGETSFIVSTLTPIDLAVNPPEPTVVAPPGAKPDGTASPKPAPKPKTEEKKAPDDAKRLAELRTRVEKFYRTRPAERETRWLAMIRQTKPIEEKFRSKYKRWLNELREALLAKLGDAAKRDPEPELRPDQIEAILFNSNVAKQRLLSLAHGIYVEASKAGIDSAVNDLGGNFAFDVVDPKVVDAISKRELILSKSTETLRNRVKKTLEKGVENSETIHQLQDRLRNDFNSFSGARALMVARTEVAAATNTARNLTFQEEGVDSTEWITARDEAVRDSHAAQDGDKAAVGTPFANGLLYPGDPAGDAGEVINCRCLAIPVVK